MVVDNKFVFQDVQYYVTIDKNNRLSRIYFNQFNSEVNSNIGKIDGVYDKQGNKWMFVIDESTYSIDSSNILRWEYTPEGKEPHEKFVQEIIDGTFTVSGIRYVVQGDFDDIDDGLYLMYFEGKEFHLVSYKIDSGGFVDIDSQGIHMDFL